MAVKFWVGGTGTWNSTNTANWANTDGGASGATVPIAGDTCYFSALSGTGTVTMDGTAPTVLDCRFESANLIYSLSASWATATASTIFTAGTLNLNNFTLTTAFISSSVSTARTINFGTGKIVVTGNSGNVVNFFNLTNYSQTGTPRIELSYAGSTGTRTMRYGDNSGTATQSNTPDIYVTAGSDIIRFNFNATSTAVRTFDTTGFSGSIEASAIRLFGSLNLSATTTVSASANAINFISTQSGNTITTNGVLVDRPLVFNGVGGEWATNDNLTVGPTRSVTLTNGTFNGGTANVSLGTFALGVGTKTLSLGSGTWTVAGSGTAWNANTNVANLTVSASTGIISMTSASAKTFAGGAKVWPTLNQGGAGALTIQQSNTFANITDTVQPATVTLTAGTTQTVNAFSLAGTAGNLITLNSSSAGVQATLSDSSGVVNVSFVSIKDINATGGAVWNAYSSSGNIDAGNNTGWDFNDLLFRYIYTRRKNKVIFPI
jgi:hypothetical protein